MQKKLTTAIQEMEQCKIEGFYDKIINDDSSGAAYEILERFIFGEDEGVLEIPQNALGDLTAQPEAVSMEVEMANGEDSEAKEQPTLDTTLPPSETMETDVNSVTEPKDTAPIGDEAPR